jgi:hypothetical protein
LALGPLDVRTVVSDAPPPYLKGETQCLWVGVCIQQVILLEGIVPNWISYIAIFGIVAGLVVDAYLLAGLAGFLP